MNVYDFDKTIYDGDSTADFYFFSLKRHKKIITLFPSLISAFCRFYIMKTGTKTEFKEKMYRFLKYVDYEKDIADFWKTHEQKLKSFYLKQKKEDDVIISASPVFLLKPICKKLGVKLIASRVNPKTGEYNGVNCHGEEKVRRFREIYGNAEIEKFYSDSKSDLPLAKLSKKAYLVKGEAAEEWSFDT